MIAFALRFVAAGILVSVLPLVAEHFGNKVAGAMLLFPAVTISGLCVQGLARGTHSLASVAVGSIVALPAVLIFLAAIYLAARVRLPLVVVLSTGMVAWLVAAVVIVGATSRNGPSS